MLRGYAQDSRRSAASGQEQALRAAGVTEVYVEDKTGMIFEAELKSLRHGDSLAVVVLADLAKSRRELRKRMDAVHAKGCFITETSTGRTTRKKADALAMLFDATDILTHAGKGHDPKKAREYGKKGGRPRKLRGMPAEEAKRHWFDTRHPTNAEALKHMMGWTAGAAYRHFGPTNRSTGPRGESMPKRKQR